MPQTDLVEFIGGSAYVDGPLTEPFSLDSEGFLTVPDATGLRMLKLKRSRAGLPHVTIDGDRAVVTSYLQILAAHPTAEFNRGAGAWCIEGLSHPSRRRQPLGTSCALRKAGRLRAAPIARSTVAIPRWTFCEGALKLTAAEA